MSTPALIAILAAVIVLVGAWMFMKQRRPTLRKQFGPEYEPLFADEVAAVYRTRWSGIQDWFVDEPRQAVQEADVLAAKTIRRLVERFADERRSLEAQWERRDGVPTEELRLAMRRYQSFFERLLSA
jgi:hypothetical protein